MSTTVLVVGASRGLGLALAEELSTRPNLRVIGSVRQRPHHQLQSLNVETVELNITDDTSVAKTAKTIPDLDILILNAAIGDREPLLGTSVERLTEYMTVNVIGFHRVLLEFLPCLRRGKGKKILIVSSQSGSMEKQINAIWGPRGPYAVTKAACNMLAIQYHNELKEDGFTVSLVHPGWIDTEMGNKVGKGGMSPATSAKGVVDLVLNLTPEDSAKFFQWDGSVLPW